MEIEAALDNVARNPISVGALELIQEQERGYAHLGI